MQEHLPTNIAKGGQSTTFKDKFSNKGQRNHTPNKIHAAEFFSTKVFTWIRKNQATGENKKAYKIIS
jgi:hypothetical protein